MDTSTKNVILEFHENNQFIMRKRYNLEKPGRMEEAIDLLEDWIQKQPHFTKKDLGRKYLEICLITCKGSIERAKNRIEKLCTLRSLLPEYYSSLNPIELSTGLEKLTGGVLPKMDNDHNRIIILKDVGLVPSSAFLKQHYKYILCVAEYLKVNDYCDGHVIFYDLSNSNMMDMITSINLIELKNFMTLLIDGYGMRMKGLHLIVAPTTLGKSIDMIVSIFKSFLPEKLASRVHVHKSVEAIHQFVPKYILPVDYDGKENCTLNELWEKWNRVLCSPDIIDYLNETNKARVDESFKQTDKYYEKHFGLPGSFRTLDLD